MSKLDGNNRWGGKMLLTEHQEQYDQRQDKKTVGRPTREELDMIRDVVLLPHLITMVQKSIEDMGLSRIALKAVVVRCLEVIMFRISDDYYALKRELKQRNIKVISEEANDGVLYFRYYCRGYEERFGIVREKLRSDVTLAMTKYTNDIGKILKQNNQS